MPHPNGLLWLGSTGVIRFVRTFWRSTAQNSAWRTVASLNGGLPTFIHSDS